MSQIVHGLQSKNLCADFKDTFHCTPVEDVEDQGNQAHMLQFPVSLP